MADWMTQQMQAAGAGLVSKITEMVPPVPSGVTTACGTISDFTNQLGVVAWMIPGSYLAVAFSVVLVGVVAAVAIRFVRISVSGFTGGGGA